MDFSRFFRKKLKGERERKANESLSQKDLNGGEKEEKKDFRSASILCDVSHLFATLKGSLSYQRTVLFPQPPPTF